MQKQSVPNRLCPSPWYKRARQDGQKWTFPFKFDLLVSCHVQSSYWLLGSFFWVAGVLQAFLVLHVFLFEMQDAVQNNEYAAAAQTASLLVQRNDAGLDMLLSAFDGLTRHLQIAHIATSLSSYAAMLQDRHPDLLTALKLLNAALSREHKEASFHIC